MNNNINDKKKLIIYLVIISILIIAIIGVSFAFFNYTKTGPNNVITTNSFQFDYLDSSSISISNVEPISSPDVDNTVSSNFQISSQNDLTNGIRYRVYLVYGEAESGKTRFLDDVMAVQFTPPADGNGFTTSLNNHATPTSPAFVNGKALISTGTIQNVNSLTSKTYNIKLFIDENKIDVSSTTKRETNAEGNPSLAVTTSGTVNVDRYIRNDNTLVSTKLFPATSEQEGKIIYTTKEYSNSYYSVKVVVEAEDVKDANEKLVYFNANGGTVNTDSKLVEVGQTYGTLPTPTRTGYTFLGWNGNNLLNSEAWVNSITSVIRGTFNKSGSLVTLTATQDDCYTSTYMSNSNLNAYKIYVNPNTTYTLSWKSNNQNVSGSVFLFYDNYSEKLIAKSQNQNSGSKITFTTNADTEYITFRLGVSNSGNTITYYDMKLEEGSTATTYEPYYVTSSVNVTQNKDHVLTAIWQKNS